MRFLFFTGLDMAAAALVLLPIFLILNRYRFHSSRRTALYFLFALYLVGVISVVGLPNVTYLRFAPNVNLIPFKDMMAGLTATVLNVVLFVPLGCFLTALWLPYGSLKRMLTFGFCTSLAIELLQVFTFRATDVNDLITNTLGTLLGWCLGHAVIKYFPSLPRYNIKQDLTFIFISVALVMFFVHPFLMNLIWEYIL